MDTGAFKGLELILIVAVVGWFYFSQMGNLKKLKEEREAKADEPAEAGTDDPSTPKP